MLGGTSADNIDSFGLAIGTVPSKQIPEVVNRITERFRQERNAGEPFREFIQRIGKKVLRADLEDIMTVPQYDDDPTFFSDWGDPREYTLDDIGIGECAGQVVTPVQFGLAAAEREVFEAQLHLDDRDFFNAWHVARGAMLQAARTLVSEQLREIPDGPEVIIREFRKRFYDTKLFFDDYASGKFANYLFRRYQEVPAAFTGSTVRRIIEEAQLFIEASHVCHTRLMVRKTPGNGTIRKLKRTELAKSRNVIDMEIQRFGIKIYLEEDQGFYPKDLIPVFHGWIQNDLIPHHLVIDGTDNFPTRYLVNDICAFLGKPNVYGSIYQFSGQVSLFYAKEGPCYRCLFPEPPRPARVGAFLRRGRRIGGVAGHCG